MKPITKLDPLLGGVEQRIITLPDERLRATYTSAPLARSLHTARTMLAWCADGAKDGREIAGLSSIQVQLPGRVITWLDVPNGRRWHALIDPEIVESDGRAESFEGCFSTPGTWAVQRPVRVVLRGTYVGPKRSPAAVSMVLMHRTAAFALHELDHLNGVLICDHGRRVGV